MVAGILRMITIMFEVMPVVLITILRVTHVLYLKVDDDEEAAQASVVERACQSVQRLGALVVSALGRFTWRSIRGVTVERAEVRRESPEELRGALRSFAGPRGILRSPAERAEANSHTEPGGVPQSPMEAGGAPRSSAQPRGAPRSPHLQATARGEGAARQAQLQATLSVLPGLCDGLAGPTAMLRVLGLAESACPGTIALVAPNSVRNWRHERGFLPSGLADFGPLPGASLARPFESAK